MSQYSNDPIYAQAEMKVSTDLSAKQYHIVKVASDGLQLTSAASDVPLGTLEDPLVSTATVTPSPRVRIGGTGKVKLSATVVKGELLMSHTDGTAIVRTGAVYTIGQALEGGVSGDIIEYRPFVCYYAA